MNYYIVDDNIATVKTLENLVTKRKLGTVVGTETNPVAAVTEIRRLCPDIVLVDLLMGGMDGITLVSRVRETNPDICFVMISKVTDKTMVQSAYNAGVEFFINKPVSLVEVERVLGNVAERIRMRAMLANLRTVFEGAEVGSAAPAAKRIQPEVSRVDEEVRKLDVLFGALGMLGERGVQDIRAIYKYMIDHDCVYDKSILTEVAEQMNDTVKNVEQRVRRAIRRGLSNAASAGIDDFGSETFVIYANYVFEFTSLKDEMNYQQGRGVTGGRVSISKFMEGLLLYSRCVE